MINKYGMAIFACLSLCLIASPARSNQLPSPEKAHYVFAHYMVCYMASTEFYKREIEMAQRHGIDGFALNCGGWAKYDPATGTLSDAQYRQTTDRIYEAAKELGTGFKLFISADLTGIRPLVPQMNDMVARYYDHPNQFRWHGKPVISAWSGSPDGFAGTMAKIKANGFDVVFVPFMYTQKYSLNWSDVSATAFFEGFPYIDGIFNFGVDATTGELIRCNAVGRRVTSNLGKIFMASASPAYNSSNLRDYHGMGGYGAVWRGIINDNADWIELTTWNDYNEDSGVAPYRRPGKSQMPYFDHDEAFLDVTAYYSSWFENGVPPPITQDKLYYVYRNRSKNMTSVWDDGAGKWVDVRLTPFPYDQIHDDVLDNVYVTTFLTAPANLTITLGSATHKYDVPAGVQTTAVPMQPGVPHFVLTRSRGGTVDTILDVLGRKQIIASPDKLNSLVEDHLANRTWSGADASGPGLRIEAAACKLGPGASIVKMPGHTFVQTAQVPGSGFSAPLLGLKTGTYCIRIAYRNSSAAEARLTVTSDGPSAAPTDQPYVIPAFLPPTGNTASATTSFFWSLYASTSFISLTWQPAIDGRANEQDLGAPAIESIELVRVDDPVVNAVKPTIWPHLVSIPGGAFAMGSNDGDPCEQPVHRVSISPFWIGKTEVTNAEYERFDAAHKTYRDSYSWRDSDPAIYVSWLDGARYCNWLSKQAGLIPAYDEKSWSMDVSANGFRMPSEAQWEYCASGRGEGRKYPWGNTQPDTTRGNFAADPLTQSSAIRDPDTGGTVPAGIYPAGASRDGVLDMAGNVAQWCSDYFQLYTSSPQTDPCYQTPGNYRSIRGGSFGYYAMSQRSSSREFNSPGYPGYIYIGLRVVLPESGAQALGL